MRRSALLGTLLLLSGCSGLGNFFYDTERLPGQNPNATTGVSENLQRSRGASPSELPIEPEPGNVWPGPPQPLPTLSDASRNGSQSNGLLGGAGPAMPSGGSMSLGEHQAIQNGAPLDNGGFSGGGLSPSVNDPSLKFRSDHPSREGASGNIVIPNGDGTSTVISPDGSVKTVKGVPK